MLMPTPQQTRTGAREGKKSRIKSESKGGEKNVKNRKRGGKTQGEKTNKKRFTCEKNPSSSQLGGLLRARKKS